MEVHEVNGGGVVGWRIHGVAECVEVWVVGCMVGWVVEELMEWVQILTHR